MRVQRLAWQLWPWRWARAFGALLRGVRQHTSVVLLGHATRCAISRGSVLGVGVRVDLGASGRLALEEGVWLAAGTEIETASMVSIGAGTTVQRRGSINGKVRIGRGCILAPNVFVSSGTHPFRHMPHLPIREQEGLLAAQPGGLAALDRPVWIQDDCWLGVNAVVCPGVTVGKGSVVGANAVVTRDVAPYSVVGGVPARLLSRRLSWQPPPRISAEHAEDAAYVVSGRCETHLGRAMFKASVTEPLQAVLRAHASQVVLDCAATHAMTITFGGHRFDVHPGEQTLMFAAESLPLAFEGKLVDIGIAADASADIPSRELHVFQITSD